MLVSLREPMAVLRRHRRLVVAITLAVAGIVGYWAYTAVPSYRAVAVIRFSDPRRALTGGVAEAPARGLESRSSDPLLSLVELLRSRTVAAVVVDGMPVLRFRGTLAPSTLANVKLAPTVSVDSLQLTFRTHSLVIKGPSDTIRTTYGAPVELDGIRFAVVAPPAAEAGVLRVVSRETAINGLIGRLRMTPRPLTDVIDVAYVATDPVHAQQVVNRVVQVFRAMNAQEAQRQSRLRREFLEAQLRVSDSLLAEARRALTAFRRRAGRVGPEFAGPAQAAGVDALQLQREQLDADRRTLRTILVSLDTARGGTREAFRTAASMPDVSANAVVSQALAQLAQHEQTRDSLTAWSMTHPDLARVNQLIATTEAKLMRAVQGAVRGSISSLDIRIATLDELRARRVANVERLSDSDAEEARLDERVANVRKIADDLRLEYQRARIAEAVEVGLVEIVDLATVPTKPIGIGVAEKLGLGLLLGLLLGAGAAFLRDHLRSVIGRREEVEALGMPVLSAVPRSKETRASKRQTVGPAIEAFRGLRLNLVHAYGTAGPVVFAVSSPGSRDGKSFVASNLALAFAHASYRTLLIDGDSRRGTLHRPMSAARKPGLTDFLAGDTPASAIIQATSFRSLSFVGCGVRRSDAPELLGSARMAELFAHARANFAVIIVDTPPLGAGVDAFALATLTGHLLMVLRPGMTDRHFVESKLDLLERLPVRVLGAVLNDVRDGPEFDGYSYYLEGYEVIEEAAKPRLLRSNRASS